MLAHATENNLIRLYEKMRVEGKPSPLDYQPVVDDDWSEVWEAWQDLHFLRPPGWGATPIPISEMVSWLDLHGVSDREERVWYFRLLSALESEYMKWAKQKRATKGKENGSVTAND